MDKHIHQPEPISTGLSLQPKLKEDYKWETPKKGKLRIMPISDSPWAPTGFGTNTKNVSAILVKDGHHIGRFSHVTVFSV